MATKIDSSDPKEFYSPLFNLGVYNTSMKITDQSLFSCNSMLIENEDRIIQNMLYSEANNFFEKTILTKMSECSEDSLDVIDLDESTSVIELYHYLRSKEFDFVFISQKLSTIIQNSILFSFEKMKVVKSSVTHLGKLSNIDCYMHNFKNYDNMEIICGKRSKFQFNYKLDDIVKHSISGQTQLSMWYSFILDSGSFCNLNFVSEYHPKFTQINRERRLKELFNKSQD